MKEMQNIEWKASWRDEYLKWICGFANAEGGLLIIGRNDKGEIIGLENAGKLLEELPNRARDILGIMVDVNLRFERGRDYLEIVVPAYPNPISYKGRYYYRSGSTNQALSGAALERLLLGKQGRHWDDIPLPGLNADKISAAAVEIFRKRAAKSGRVDEEILNDSDDAILDSLLLKEGGYLKRACALLFTDRPEKYIAGAYIKVGFFITDDELRYQDEIHGSLFEQVEKTLEVLRFKYLKAYISYEGIQRVEKYLFPLQALREAILNAVVHKDYGSGIPVQISVYEDLFVIWNPGQLPEKWDMEKLLSKHPSQPYNPLLAAAFFRSGYIESWGRGIEKIYRECREHKNPAPIFDYDMSGLMLSFRAGEIVGEFVEGNGNFGESVENFGEKSGDFGENFGEKSQKVGENCDRVGEKVGENRDRVGEKLSLNQQKILDLLWEKPDMSAKKLALQLDISLRKTETNISRLKKLGLLRRVGPAKGGYWLVVKSG